MRNDDRNYKILVIDDDDEVRALTAFILRHEGYKVIELNSGVNALTELYKEAIDLIILDVDMPVVDGFEVLTRIRTDFVVRHIPIMILTGTKIEIDDKVKGLGLGSDDYILKPFNHEEFVARVKSVLQRSHRMLDANPLTRLPGNIEIIKEFENRVRRTIPFVVLYADINNFKAFNDRYGFLHGDKAICLLSTILLEIIRDHGEPEDFLGHIGGDDFVIITGTERHERISQKVLEDFTRRIVHYGNHDEAQQKVN